MPARSFVTAGLLLATCAGCASGPAAPPDPGNAIGERIRGQAQCLDPSMARSWIDLDDDTLLVDAGRFHYRIEISGACSSVGWSPVLQFRGDPVSGRVCGNPGDAILTRDYPCTIRGMRMLDEAQYKALLDAKDARKSAAKPED